MIGILNFVGNKATRFIRKIVEGTLLFSDRADVMFDDGSTIDIKYTTIKRK